MRFHLSDLWRGDGVVGRRQYLFWGCLLFAIKYLLDASVAHFGFGFSWSPVRYLQPGEGIRLGSTPRPEIGFYATLVALALPFIWSGTVLTLRRLRSAQLPLWLVVVFFLPILNLCLFLLLVLAPERVNEEQALAQSSAGRPTRVFRLAVPDHPLGSAVLGVIVTVPIALAGYWFSIRILEEYGWMLFVGLPLVLGYVAVLIYGCGGARTYWSCVGVAIAANVIAGVVLLALGFEGVLCLVMAAPLPLGLAWIGGYLGYLTIKQHWQNRPPRLIVSCLLLITPCLMGAEKAVHRAVPVFCQRTSVIIHAPPERVWHYVVSFPALPEPTEPLFRAGISYPMSARIKGTGPGAIRQCIFSTGAFIEPIQVWNEPRLLKFSVIHTPPPLVEWSPYPDVDPPHLHNYLVAREGQFRLTPLPGGRTLLQGATWYQHHLWPAGYWSIWSNQIIEAIHLRVLNHIKRLCEGPGDRTA